VGSPRSDAEAGAPIDALRRLQHVTDAALAHLQLDELLRELMSRIRDALDADTSALLLLDEASNELVARAAKGLEEEVERGVRIPVGKGFAGRIAAERRPVVIADVDHSEVLNPILREKGIKSLLGAPLISDGRFLGVIHVGTLTHRTFTKDDVDLLEVVAQRAALAIDHAVAHEHVVRLTELQRDFIALAAHELRTPATTVYGLATTLRERSDELDADTVAQLEETLWSQSDRMRRLVEQLLDLSRLDAASIAIRREKVLLREQLAEIVSVAAPSHVDEVKLDVAPDLQTILDPVALERIVTNLVINAVRYGSAPVTIRAEQTDRHLRIWVEDRGSGVEESFIPHLFHRFRRSERSRGSGEGAGLGLAIAQSYAHALGGDLFYSPAEPSGARFELVVPNVGVSA
jgi:signal transduction histidine kinase